jgi:hypothetical protein
MTSAHPPSHSNGTSRTRKPRPRSTIGINPLDLSPLPAAADERAPGSPASAGDSDRSAAGKGVFAAWAAGTESVLKALFDAHDAALRANQAALEASANTQRQIAHEWTEAARQARDAALGACRTGLQAASPPHAEDDRPPRG